MVGNPEAIALLEYWLDQAKKGDIYFAALAAVKLKDQVAYDYAGAKGLESNARIALKTLEQELDAIEKSRKLSPRDFNLNASYVEYPLLGTPICWDFLVWLIDAEMTRRRLKGPPPLKVCFTGEEQLDRQSRDFFENVFRPVLPLIGAVEDIDAKGGRHKQLYTPIDIVNASRGGEEVPRLSATSKAKDAVASWLHGIKPVTITLREAPHWKHRNSNLEAWLKFAYELQNEGKNVVFIRDTAKANEALPGFATCPIAAFNVDLRMALYEQAEINLMISNGPAGLALFSDVPYLYFVNIQKGDKLYVANNTDWWFKSNGIGEGEQWPWAKEGQKMIWKRDTYDNIKEAWDAYRS